MYRYFHAHGPMVIPIDSYHINRMMDTNEYTCNRESALAMNERQKQLSLIDNGEVVKGFNTLKPTEMTIY
ncbi:hypothetical protein BLOT_010062 [Blomia tropicalis]|nr:hypothetical protein BLOT_010062 [Blomia tropicalis]